MKVPTKVFYASYLPSVKDRDKILMADNGAAVPPIKNLLSSIPDEYLNNLDRIGQPPSNGTPFNNPTPGYRDFNTAFNESNGIRNPQPYNGPYSADHSPSDPHNTQVDTNNFNPYDRSMTFNLPTQGMVLGGLNDLPHQKKGQPYQGEVGQGIVTAAAAFDAILPYGKINRWPTVRPQASYNEHPYGTGSQALMNQGGRLPGVTLFDNIIDSPRAKLASGGGVALLDSFIDSPRAKLDSGGGISLLDSFIDMDRAKLPWGGTIQQAGASGIHIKPSHKGRFTAYKKRTGKTTEEALHSSDPHVRQMANFARNAKKWHHEDGGIIELPNGGNVKKGGPQPYGNQFVAFPYGQAGTMPTTNTVDLKSKKKIPAVNDRGYVNMYNTIDQFGNKTSLNDEQIPYQYLSGTNRNNFAVGTDSVYVAPGVDKSNVKIPLKSGGSLSPSKAAEILHDGTAHGKPLTDKQRKFMGWKSHQKAPNGIALPGGGQPTNLAYTPQSRTDAYVLDDINQVLTTGIRTRNTGYSPDQQQLLTDAYIWKRKNPKIDARNSIQGYFNQPVDLNNPLQKQRARLSKIGGDPLSMYNSTPNADVRDALPNLQSHLIAGLENGGAVYANGGEIQTTYGGSAQPISYNPYDGGTTHFSGPSHENGGVGIAFNGKQVEVEGGETAAKDNEGNLNVFGNMYLPGTRTKFKTAVKEIGEKEEKMDKLKSTGTNIVNALDPINKYDQIRFNAGELMMKGGDMGQKALAEKKEKLANLQNAMLDTAKQYNLDPQGMSAGEIKKAKKGIWIKKAPNGVKIPPEENTPEYYQKIIDGTMNNIKSGNGTGEPLDDNTYNTYQSIIADAKSKLAALKGANNPYDASNDETTADRNNNMGNIKFDPNSVYGKLLMKKYGATQGSKSTEGDYFAKFPTPEAGRLAAKNLLFTGDKYKNMKLNDALTRWTHKNPYDLSGLGDLGNMKVSDIPLDQREGVLDYMKRGEGTRYGTPKTSKNIPLAGNPNTPIAPITPFGLPKAPPFTVDGPNIIPPQPKTPSLTNQTVPLRGDIPTQAKPLGFGDIASDIFAIAQNQERPVYAQKYTPQLYQPYQVSFQDEINRNQQGFNDIKRLTGYNPAALGTLAGQRYEADNRVRAEEFRTNQGISNDITNRNIELENRAQLTNLGIANQQFTNQDLANSKTREMNQIIVNDISDKYNKIKYRNNELKAYENLYNYRLQNNPNTGGLDETNYNPAQILDFSGNGARGGNQADNIRTVTNYNVDGSVKNSRQIQESQLKTEAQRLKLERDRQKDGLIPDLLPKNKNGGKVRKAFRAGYIK